MIYSRRTRDRTNPYECKSGGKCEGGTSFLFIDIGNFRALICRVVKQPISDSVPCKKCRFDKFTQLLKDKKMKRCSSKQV